MIVNRATRIGSALIFLAPFAACERTPTGLSDDELKLQLGPYEIAVIGSTADLTAVDLDSLGRVAGNFTAGGSFRWKNGVVTPLPDYGAGFVVTALNNRGDLGGTRDGKPALIFADSAFVSVLTSVGDQIPAGSTVRFLNDRREAMLTSPYGQSGMDLTAGIWRSGTYKTLNSTDHHSKTIAFNNRGTSILQYVDFYPSWFAMPSPFEAGPVPSNGCRNGRYSIAYAMNDSTHTLSLDENSDGEGFVGHDFLFANERCTDLTLTYPDLSIRHLNNLDLLGGTGDGKVFLAMDGASVPLDDLISTGGWHVVAIARINDHRQVLARAVSADGPEKWVVLSPVLAMTGSARSLH